MLVPGSVVGYCPLARLLALAPWNRKEALTAALVRRTFLSRTGSGGVLLVLPGGAACEGPEHGLATRADAGTCGIT